MNVKKSLRKSYANFRGVSINRKLVVFESDDWGSVVLPNNSTREKLIGHGLPLDNNRYNVLDKLEEPADLESLFDVLSAHRDINGNYVSFSPAVLSANPDFEAIKENAFNDYTYETLDKTYSRLGRETKMRELWSQGIDSNIFYPQFHGREHLHPLRYLKAIKNLSYERIAFDYSAIPGHDLYSGKENIPYRAAFDYYTLEEKLYIESELSNSLDTFEKVWGFRARSFVASQAIRGEHINRFLKQGGVEFHQGGQRIIPHMDRRSNKRLEEKYWGKKDDEGLIHWRRNVTFEPSKSGTIDHVSEALAEIGNAFMFGKPAVINTHRINFIGGMSEENRKSSLKMLNELISKALSKWPDLEFVNSEQLGEILLGSLGNKKEISIPKPLGQEPKEFGSLRVNHD